jgi:nicastrin
VLAAMDALKRAPTAVTDLNSTFIFAAFDAETWGFTGSKAFVKDITSLFTCTQKSDSSTDQCPLKSASCVNPCKLTTDFTKISFDQIAGIIDFDTIGAFGSSSFNSANLFMHVDSPDVSSNLVNVFRNSVPSNASLAVTLTPAFGNTNNRLPPSPIYAFLEKKRSIPAILISDYSTQFSNQFYNSVTIS